MEVSCIMWASGHPQHNQCSSSWNLLCLGRLGFLNRLFSPIFYAQLPKDLFSSKSNNKVFGWQKLWKSLSFWDTFLASKWAAPLGQTPGFQDGRGSANYEGLVCCYLWLFSWNCELSGMLWHGSSSTGSEGL